MLWKEFMKKKVIFSTVAIIFVIFLAIQFVPYGRNHSNPPITGEPNWNSATTKDLFSHACADCHSNQTSWPWYSNIAPVSWLVQKDVEEGRAKFNVSEWGRKSENEGYEAAEEIQSGKMPLTTYLLTHPKADLSNQEKNDLIQGLSATFVNKIDKHDHSHAQEDDDD
jgi:mono/diheme cytochrome c family protein